MNVDVMTGYEVRIANARKIFTDADFVIIGAGAGLSDAAGLKYNGKRFSDNFGQFIAKYKFTDLYTSSFYPFETEEERWAYWAKHISINRYDIGATQLYLDLHRLVKDKEYFVITTNVEGQFAKAGFDKQKIFAVQGDYAYFQCAKACHPKLYYNEELVDAMIKQTNDCKIPSDLVPHCPVCGGPMDVNLRKDSYFVEDENWKTAIANYQFFIGRAKEGKTVLIELGVGFNTPGIIKYPFEEMVFKFPSFSLIRLNSLHPDGYPINEKRTISFIEEMDMVIKDLDS